MGKVCLPNLTTCADGPQHADPRATILASQPPIGGIGFEGVEETKASHAPATPRSYLVISWLSNGFDMGFRRSTLMSHVIYDLSYPPPLLVPLSCFAHYKA